MYTVLAGGVGAARFLRGLVGAVDPDQLTVIANVGDDLDIHGLHVSPDLDTIVYTLGSGIHPEQQWGRADETFTVAEELQRYGAPTWFTLGDRDIATHLVRTERLRAGVPLSEVTARIAETWGLRIRLLPVTDDRVTTTIRTVDGRALHFQEYWVREHAEPQVAGVHLDGAPTAQPAPGVLAAIADAEAVLVCPSNPVVSIGTILDVPGVREAVRDTHAPVVGVSPIVGGDVVRGMADRLLRAVGAEVSALGVARLYGDWLDGWVIDERDADLTAAIRDLEIAVRVTDTMMDEVEVTTALAGVALDLARELGRR